MPRETRKRAVLAQVASPSLTDSLAIPYRTIAEYIAHWIRDRIAKRALAPGARLREARIARELQTSRAPVREAISQLAREGLVTKRPNQSARIVELSEPMLREVASLRTILESYGASLSLDRLDAQGLQVLTGIVQTMQHAAKRGEFSRVIEQDYAFHDCLMKAGGHQLLYEMWSGLSAQVRLLVSGTNHMDQDLRSIARTHARILAAIRTKDRERTHQLIGMHLSSMFERFIAQVVVGDPAKRLRERRGSNRGGATRRSVRGREAGRSAG
jgi:DNA-binding GntR family transcriptional regulator